jgi:hypothetical protein
MKDPIHEAAREQGYKLARTGSERFPFGKVLGGRTSLETTDERGEPLRTGFDPPAVLYLYPETKAATWEIIIWPESEDDWHLTCDDIVTLRAGGARIVFKGDKVYRVRRITRTPIVEKEKSRMHGKRGGKISAEKRAAKRSFTNEDYRAVYMDHMSKEPNKSKAAYYVRQAQKKDGHTPTTPRGITKYFDANPTA